MGKYAGHNMVDIYLVVKIENICQLKHIQMIGNGKYWLGSKHD